MTVEEAVAVVAERAIWAACQEIQWEDYGDIGDQDWQRVVDEIDRQIDTNHTNLELYPVAHDLLVERARTEEASP